MEVEQVLKVLETVSQEEGREIFVVLREKLARKAERWIKFDQNSRRPDDPDWHILSNCGFFQILGMVVLGLRSTRPNLANIILAFHLSLDHNLCLHYRLSLTQKIS